MDEAGEAAKHLRVGLVHGGTDPSEFLVGESSTALVDWGSVERAPLLLDVAILEVLGHASTAEIAAVIDGYASIRPEVDAELDAYPSLVRCAWLRQVAFWGERYLTHGSSPGPDDADWYGFQRSLDILRTGVSRAWSPATSELQARLVRDRPGTAFLKERVLSRAVSAVRPARFGPFGG